MKGLVIGYGSIGKRHARLLDGLGATVAVVSRRDVEADNLFKTIADAVTGFAPDYTVIASRTHEHRDDMVALAESVFKGTLLVEKPIFDTGTEVAANQFAQIFVAYNLRFHPVLVRLKEVLTERTPYAVHATVGQYLPDWRPDADYRRGYSAIKSQGGGVLRDLSHELDTLNWMLGGWTRLTALGGHFSGLEIDSDDVFSILFETAHCPVVSVQMNYLDSTLRREVLALTDQGTVRADLVRGTLEVDGEIETFTIGHDDTYLAQHQAALAGGGGLCTLPAAAPRTSRARTCANSPASR
jgi:predicted dehydrogenase